MSGFRLGELHGSIMHVLHLLLQVIRRLRLGLPFLLMWVLGEGGEFRSAASGLFHDAGELAMESIQTLLHCNCFTSRQIQ